MRLTYFILGALVGGLVAIATATAELIKSRDAAYNLAQEAYRLACLNERGEDCLNKSINFRHLMDE